MADILRDHPDIESAQRTGYPAGHREFSCICPVCGAEAEEFFLSDGEIAGCNDCITRKDAYEYAIEQEEAAKEAAEEARYEAMREEAYL